jgi:hypothetical protein
MATTLTPEAKALAAKIRAYLGITAPRSRACPGTSITAFGMLSMRINHDDFPAEIRQAMYGIDWSRRTGRIGFWVEQYIRDLSDWGWCTFIAEVATGARYMADVPYFLADRFPSPYRR